MNRLPVDGSQLKEVIMRTVRESIANARLAGKKTDEEKRKMIKRNELYKNNIVINWPPGRRDFEHLCMALNIRVPAKKLIEGVIYFRGPKMDEEPIEEFNFDKMIKWFQMNG